METEEGLRRKLNGAQELKSVVRTMKAVSASNIGQYELAVASLGDYYKTISLGIFAYFKQKEIDIIQNKKELNLNLVKQIQVIVIGSDQGLVGQFNDSLAEFVEKTLMEFKSPKVILAIGERMQLLLLDRGFAIAQRYSIPSSVHAITPLVRQLLMKSEVSFEKEIVNEVYIFHNQPQLASGYKPVFHRLLPLDKKWRQSIDELKWPSKLPPQIIGGIKPTFLALIHAYLFTTLYKAFAESLASENASRLAAMQRAEKNINEVLEELSIKFHNLRQSSIDEELFDVVSGFEAMKNTQ